MKTLSVLMLAAGLATVGAGSLADERSVTLALDRAPLTRVCAELTRQSGIPHEVTEEGKRQRVVLFCREQPAASVRRSLSSLLGWTWRRSDEGGAVRYRLSKPWSLRKQEAELRDEALRRYGELLKAASAAAQDSTQKTLPESSLLWLDVRNPVGGALFRSLAALPPGTAAELLRGEPYVGRQGSLPKEFSQTVGSLVESTNTDSGTPSSSFSREIPFALKSYVIRLVDPAPCTSLVIGQGA